MINRKEINELNEYILNETLHKRGISPQYEFGICEREETEHSKIYGDTTFTCWNLALYKFDGIFGERVEQIFSTPIQTQDDYKGTTLAVSCTQRRIMNGLYDKYKTEPIPQKELTLSPRLESIEATKEYFSQKYKNISKIGLCIDTLWNNKITSFRTIDKVLEIIDQDYSPIWLELYVGERTAQKLLAIK